VWAKLDAKLSWAPSCTRQDITLPLGGCRKLKPTAAPISLTTWNWHGWRSEADFDMLFLADTAGLWKGHDAALHRTSRVAHFEPLTLLPALAAVTRHVGFVATATTTYNAPYQIGRQLASLDLISGGLDG